jgi:replication factor A1
MSAEEIIEKILCARTDVSREEILQKMEEKKSTAGGLLTEETAARLVALELGVEVAQELFHPKEIPVGDLVLGLNNVTVTGRVLMAYPMQTYARKNGTEGQYAYLLIADRSGMLRIVLWNDKAELVRDGKLKQGQVVRVLHGYVREARDGQPELHLGQRSELQITPKDVKEDDYPKAESFVEKIGGITKRKKKANVAGAVRSVSPVTVFKRRDGSEGRVLRAVLTDATGQIPAVFWNDKVNTLDGVLVGDRLQVIDAKVKERIDGRLELHVENRAFVERLPPVVEEVVKIGTLEKEDVPVTVVGIVRTKTMKREVTTSKGEKVTVASFELEDESGKIWVSAWRRHAEVAERLSVGAKVRMKDVYVRKGFGDSLEISTRSSSKIEVLTE